MWEAPPWVVHVMETLSPGRCDLMAVPSVSDDVTVVPPILVITAPAVIPASAEDHRERATI